MTPATPHSRRRFVLGISGASGAAYSLRLLELLLLGGHEVHLVVSDYGRRLLAEEAGVRLLELGQLLPTLAQRPDAEAIVHTHSPRATALACARRAIPPFHYMIALVGGPGVRCAEYATFGTQSLADNALRGLEGRRAVLLANHGVIAIGATLETAYEVACEVENMDGQYLQLLAAGLEPVSLDEAEMQRVLGQFARYGREY